MTILNGKEVSKTIKNNLKSEVKDLIETTGIVPSLSIILVGSNPASEIYVRNKIKAANYCGINANLIRKDEDIQEEELVNLVNQLNEDQSCHGIIVQLPLPKHINEQKVIDAINANKYDTIILNYANPDMVGHTGVMEAAVNACSAVDICLSKIIEKAEENFYKVIILADHGNADTMINEDGSICTTHTTSKVPFIICDDKVKLKSEGTLVNVAPTILDYMDIAIPKEMEGTESLLISD